MTICKRLALILALCLCLGLLSVTASAAPKAETTQWVVEEIVPCKYDYAGNFSEGLAAVNLNGKWGYIDAAGKEVIPCKYRTACDFCQGFAVVSDETEGLGLVDKTGREIVPCKYAYASDFSEGLAAVMSAENKGWGFVDETGLEVIPCQYTVVRDFSDGLAMVESCGMYGYIDKTGANVIPCQYIMAGSFFEGLAPVYNGKWGYVDKTGTEVIPCQYRDARVFSGGLAAVSLDGERYGFINRDGKEVIPYQYFSGNWAEDLLFEDGFCIVEQEGEADGWNSVCIMDKTGKILTPEWYARIYPCSDGMFLCQKFADLYDSGTVHSVGKVYNWLFDASGKHEPAFIGYGLNNYVGPFDGDLALASISVTSVDDPRAGASFLIDRAGQEIIRLAEGQSTTNLYDGEYLMTDETGKWGLYSITKADDPASSPKPSDNPKPSTTPSAKPSESPKPSAAPVAVTGVSVAKTASVQVGRTKTLTASVKPSNAENKSVYWTSDDTYVVSVDTDGKITGVKAGTANVTVTTLDGGFTAACAVTVTKAPSLSGGGGGGSSSGGGGGGGSSSGGSGSGSAQPTTAPSAQPSQKPIDTTKPASENFSDVVKDSWYENGVTYVVKKGLFNGVAQGQFAPQQNMTRAMLVTVLARLDGQDTTGGKSWYSKGTDWAMAQGVSDGTMLDQSVTREQMVTMLYRYAKATAGTGGLSKFADVRSVSDWAKDAMAWAVANGILTGKDGNRLDPQGTATRAEVATILQRFVEKK